MGLREAREVLWQEVGVGPLPAITMCVSTSVPRPCPGLGWMAAGAGPSAGHHGNGWTRVAREAAVAVGGAERGRSGAPGGLQAGHGHLGLARGRSGGFTSPFQKGHEHAMAVPEWGSDGGC